jgi:ABC-type nitrate/sulfonate/bicarbonate transport system permease component
MFAASQGHGSFSKAASEAKIGVGLANTSFNADDVLFGMGIAAIAGLALAVLLGWMERRFDETEQKRTPS